MTAIKYVPLYSVEKLSAFKSDRIFDVNFIQEHLGCIGVTDSYIKKTSINDYGQERWGTPVYPIVFSKEYTADWWRFNSPTRFAYCETHNKDIYEMSTEPVSFNTEVFVNAQRSLAKKCYSKLKKLKFPVITKEVIIGIFNKYFDKLDNTHPHDLTHRVLSKYMCIAERKLKCKLIPKIFNVIEKVRDMFDGYLDCYHSSGIVPMVVFRNAYLVRTAICFDIIETIFPSFEKNQAVIEYNIREWFVTEIHKCVTGQDTHPEWENLGTSISDKDTSILKFKKILWVKDEKTYRLGAPSRVNHSVDTFDSELEYDEQALAGVTCPL